MAKPHRSSLLHVLQLIRYFLTSIYFLAEKPKMYWLKYTWSVYLTTELKVYVCVTNWYGLQFLALGGRLDRLDSRFFGKQISRGSRQKRNEFLISIFFVARQGCVITTWSNKLLENSKDKNSSIHWTFIGFIAACSDSRNNENNRAWYIYLDIFHQSRV